MIKVTITIEEVKERDVMKITKHRSIKEGTTLEAITSTAVLNAVDRIIHDLWDNPKKLGPEACRD